MRLRTHLTLTIVLFLWSSLLLALPPQAGVNARGIVESAEISGVDEADISQDIRDAVRKLVGEKFDQQVADDLVQRIQDNLPEFIATTRLLAGSQADRVKVMFTVEKRNEEPGGEANINSRYIVERVEVQGFDESKLSQSVRDAMQMLVGEKLDGDKANEIRRRIEIALRPKYVVARKVTKGSDRQHIIVIYEVKKVPWIPFLEVPAQHFVYHSKQNFSAVVSANLFDDDNNRFYVGLADDQDYLLERFAGFGAGFESTSVGTDRLGVALRYSRYHERWQPSTVLAGRTDVYRERNVFEPTVTFAFDPRVRLIAGVSLSDLQIQYPDIHRANANAITGSLIVRNVWGDGASDKHVFDANYDFRAGNHQFESDFIYTRHLVRAQYAYGHERSKLSVSFLAGTIAGNAPLFERFSLGNTSTLRGWNKFDVAPVGGNRVIYGSLQYGFGGPRVGTGDLTFNGKKEFHAGFHLFYDTGAVGDSGSPIKSRHSAGIGFGSADSSSFFMEVGFPIRSGHSLPVFAMGFRF